MRHADGAAAMRRAEGLGQFLNRWLTRDRCLAWCGGLLALELLAVLFVVAGSYGLIWEQRDPISASFVSFYAAGTLADGDDPALAYDRAAHAAAEDAARIAGIPHPVFTYPPVFLLICGLLARLPYLPAFVAFQAIPLAVLGLALARTLGLRGRRPAWPALLPFLAFPALWETLALGQNALLTAALFACGLLLLPERPLLAGLVLGTLCYKPHLGLLLPVAFVAGRQWRTFAGAALTVAGWVALSVAAFGAAPWRAYLAAVPAMPSFYASGDVAFAAMVSPLGAARVLGMSPSESAMVQAAAAITAAVAVAWVWRRDAAPAVRAGTLLAGTLLAAPLLLFYDQMLAALCIAFLVRQARTDGWLAGEKPLLGLVVGVSLCAPFLAAVWAVPLGPVPAMLLLGLCVAHARQGQPPAAWAALSDGRTSRAMRSKTGSCRSDIG